MRGGRLRERFHLQKPSTSVSIGSGGVATVTYATTGTIWAERLETTMGEDLEGGEQHGTVRATFRVRHWPGGIDSKSRLVEAGSTANVWDVMGAHDPTGRREELRVRAVRRDA